MQKKVYKFKKYSKRKVFRGDQSILANLFCLATPEYCSLFKSLNGNLKKLIKNIANIPGTELENFTILEVKNKIVGFYSGYSSLEIRNRQLKTSLIMRNLLKKERKIFFTKKIQKNINSLPVVNNKSFYISRNSISLKKQKTGFGTILLNKIIKDAKSYRSISLHANLKNKKANKFYIKHGLNKIKTRNNFALYEKKLKN